MPLMPTLAAPLGSRMPVAVGPSRTLTSETDSADGTSRASSNSVASRGRGRRAVVRGWFDSQERSQLRGDITGVSIEGGSRSGRPSEVSADSEPAGAHPAQTISEHFESGL